MIECGKTPIWPVVVSIAACCSLLPCASAAPQDDITSTSPAEAKRDEAELAKTIQNPLANLVSLPLQFNFNEGVGGAADRRLFNLNIQPVIPYPGEKWNLITRTIIPVNSLPVGETDSEFGIGDTSVSLFWSPARASSITWGIGPALVLPTASNPELLGSEKFSLGPTGVIFAGLGQWTLGAVVSNVWSVSGESDRADVDFFFAQWFVNYNLGSGWALGTAPIITCDWESESDTQCTIPWGLQVSKVTHFGSLPVNLLLGYYENAEHPEAGAESQVRFQVNFMFPLDAKQ